MKINLSKPAYLYVFGWYPEENTNQLVNVISYPKFGKVKQSYNFPPDGEAFFLISETFNFSESIRTRLIFKLLAIPP